MTENNTRKICVNDLQINLINTRRKYIKTIMKTERQSHKIELKILERIKLVSENIENNYFAIDENLFIQDIENKQMINSLKHKLKNLENNVTSVARVVNCDIYKEIIDK